MLKSLRNSETLKKLRSLSDAVILLWIYERYDGFPEALKPPLGFSPYVKPSRLERLAYKCKRLLWRIEKYFYRGVHDRRVKEERFFKDQFLQVASIHQFEPGVISTLDWFVSKAIESSGRAVYSWLWTLFMNPRYEKYRISIVQTLSHQDWTHSEYAMQVAYEALSSEDPELQEAGLRCIENWDDPYGVTFLEIVQPLQLEYLEEHRLSLIETLKPRFLKDE